MSDDQFTKGDAWMLPMFVSVLGKRYHVKARRRDSSSLFGCTDLPICSIEIAEHLDQQEAAETLLHEVIHILDFALCTGFDEADIGRLSAGVFAVLKDNPGIAPRD